MSALFKKKKKKSKREKVKLEKWKNISWTLVKLQRCHFSLR